MLLRIESLSKYFGSVAAADAVDLEGAEGEALGIAGPNGAGKTTLFNPIAGVVPPDAGRIPLDGRDVTGAPPQKRCIAGIETRGSIPERTGRPAELTREQIHAAYFGF